MWIVDVLRVAKSGDFNARSLQTWQLLPMSTDTILLVQNVYLCTSDQLAETGGERPHKMKSPQTPFRTT
jgi:hypothetical protein